MRISDWSSDVCSSDLQTPMKEQVQFITITTDPENDTPDVLRAYGPVHGLDPVNWAFLTTTPDPPEDATRLLAEAHGHKFTETEDGYQVHSRSEERRVGKECVSTGRSRWSQYH